jgi:hypothetical protein
MPPAALQPALWAMRRPTAIVTPPPRFSAIGALSRAPRESDL